MRVVFGMPELLRFRRMLGLFVYFYATIHLLCYSWLDMGFEWMDIAIDIPKRPFILVGFTAFMLLTPLAATSFNKAIRGLGNKRWQMLHRAVYVVAALAVLHFYWMRAGKSNFAEVIVYGAILAALLLWRAWNKRFARH
jgi:sulfoxide reductase heme-binding subunit YedZ